MNTDLVSEMCALLKLIMTEFPETIALVQTSPEGKAVGDMLRMEEPCIHNDLFSFSTCDHNSNK